MSVDTPADPAHAGSVAARPESFRAGRAMLNLNLCKGFNSPLRRTSDPSSFAYTAPHAGAADGRPERWPKLNRLVDVRLAQLRS